MSGDTEIDDPEVSDGASENEYSDHDPELGKEEDDNTDMAEQKFRPDSDENGTEGGSAVAAKPKYDPKDPLRPRRKKARRACFACQRAHLTCGMFFPLLCLMAWRLQGASRKNGDLAVFLSQIYSTFMLADNYFASQTCYGKYRS